MGKKQVAERHTSIEELAVLLPCGIRTSHFVAGDEDNAAAPHVFISDWPPNVEASPHSHAVDYFEFVISGTQRVGKKWYKAGDIRIVTGGTNYGPLVSGPEGCRVMVMFAGSAWEPIPIHANKDASLYPGRFKKMLNDNSPSAEVAVSDSLGYK